MSESFDARLRRLPARRAPRTLAPRVLAAAALYARPWHRRPFWTWTLPAQAAFVAAVALGAAALLWLGEPVAASARILPGLDTLAPLGRALSRLLWLARLPLLGLVVMSAVPAAALASVALSRRTS